MPEFTERQNAIIALLISNRFLRNAQLAEMLNVSAATIAADIAQLQKHFGCIRQSIPGRAKQAGWYPPLPDEPDETPEQMMERIIGESLPPGRLRKLRLKSAMMRHALGNFQQTLDLTQEVGMKEADYRKRLDDLYASLCKVQQVINSAIIQFGDMRNNQ